MLNRREVSKLLLAGLGAGATLSLGGCGAPHANGADAPERLVDAQGDPTHEALMKAGPLGDITMGRKDAPVTVIEYESLTCPYCRHFSETTFPKIKRAYIDTGKVRYIVREFPIGHASGAAAIVNRCAGEDKYFTLMDKFLHQQNQWKGQTVRKDAIYKVAAQVGMSREKFDSCLANQSIIDGLKWVKQRGRDFNIIGTPTFFVNGKKARGALTFDQMKKLIEPQLA